MPTPVLRPEIGPPAASRESPTRRVPDWTVDDVVTWLHHAHLGGHEAAFRQARATGAYLMALTADNLTTMGITTLKQRKEVMKAVHALQDDAHRDRIECLTETSAALIHHAADEPDAPEFNEDESHQSFLEALHEWRGQKPTEVSHIATETITRPTSTLATVCWQCFKPLKAAVVHKDGHDFCSSPCEAAHVKEVQRQKLAAKATQSTAALHHQHIQATWALDIKFTVS
ncbi:hypothetical protein H310_03327 [Aphanomyces invadans]|uniref:SAM domain-containing protein n=1 Tax=Aphanomyces invadans TaxID=157072 RepID=A0A024UIZ3_9STRA|nr:hypothetical protein H310_03327 [Aphanomyces invadans]ETW05583.1 hypothetical protein H310_03327 [Aphanomyces invadans]|eukprot:XP_008865360.1 hypothetical protein H310_03327 [Aphanomyces invadans]